jgi:BTB/POZ domain-containing protein 10
MVKFAVHVMQFRHGKIQCPANVSVSELHEACNFFLVPFTHSSVACENVAKLLTELSNNGARRQFADFLDHNMLPAMARSAQVGFVWASLLMFGFKKF